MIQLQIQGSDHTQRINPTIFSIYIDGTDWDLQSIDGLCKPDLTVFATASASGSGDIVTAKHVNSREIKVVCKAVSSQRNNDLREQYLKMFRPGFDYTLTVTRSGNGLVSPIVRTAEWCALDSISIPEPSGDSQCVMTLNFLCPSGFLMSLAFDETTIDKSEWLAGREITNNGAIDGMVRATFVASGSVVRPFVELTYGGITYKIQSNLTLSTGQMLSFTGGGEKYIEFRAATPAAPWTRVYGLLLNDWRALSAPVGDSLLHCGAASGEANLSDVSCSLLEYYMGV